LSLSSEKLVSKFSNSTCTRLVSTLEATVSSGILVSKFAFKFNFYRYAVGIARRLIEDPLYYHLGWRYGTKAVDWLEVWRSFIHSGGDVHA
jgi:hypothetical protein